MNLKQVVKQLGAKASSKDKQSILKLLKQVPAFYPELINHPNLLLLKEAHTELTKVIENWLWPSLTSVEEDVCRFAALLCSFDEPASTTIVSDEPLTKDRVLWKDEDSCYIFNSKVIAMFNDIFEDLLTPQNLNRLLTKKRGSIPVRFMQNDILPRRCKVHE
ncbi:hypothetical protein ACFL3Q_08580, partial [Planctomycetota bacterium]